MSALERSLGYTFQNSALLVEALTHPSYGADHHQPHYQRLEFLGDAVLQLAITAHLVQRYPDENEGTLTRARAAIVCESSLGEAARALGVGEAMRLSPGEERSGGRNKPSILSDALEALFGAVFLDGGMDAALSVIHRALAQPLAGDPIRESLDHKSLLQMKVQRLGLPSPAYELTGAAGEPHKPVFTMRVSVDGRPLGEGQGQSKQAAEQMAARQALERGEF